MSTLGSRIGLRQSLGRGQLLDLEVASSEKEAGEAEEARIAARDEDACARLVVVTVERHAAPVVSGVRGAPRRPGHAVADLEPAPARLARGQFDHLAGAAAGDRAPRPDLVLDLDHDLVGVQEDGVDREAHERGVDAPARPEDHALTLPEVLAAEEAAHAPVRAVGDDDSFADDPAVLPAERQCRHRAVS